jgi:uncharacterized protein (TIGR03437 family)
MKAILGLLTLFAALAFPVWADTTQTISLLTTLLPSNETPPTTVNAIGNALILVHVIRDSSGNITSGSVEFNVSATFPAAATVTGLHIHKAPAGVAGPILIPTDVRSDSLDSNFKASYDKLVNFPAAGGAEPTAATVADLIQNPGSYYVNLHTTDNPGGAIRGQLLAADVTTLIGNMSPANETPPITNVSSSGVSIITVFRALDAAGNIAVANVLFDLRYNGFASGTTFTGYHIHKGPAGIAGPVIINTGIGGSGGTVAADPSGAGGLTYLVPVRPTDSSFANESDTINGLFTNPNGFYVNTHNTVHPGGEIRDQLKTMDRQILQVTLQPGNETPPVTGSNADAVTAVTIDALRNPDGTIAAGQVNFNVNFRNFPASTTITGLHIHQGLAGVAGPIVIPTPIGGTQSVTTDTGTGNVHRAVIITPTFPNATALQALNTLVQDPSAFYENLHTTVSPGGAIRNQLAPAALPIPAINGVAATSSTITTGAPGSILSIYGTNLSPATAGLDGFYAPKALATSMDGVSVIVGGVKAPLYFISPGQINAQTPFEVTPGTLQAVVTNLAGVSLPSNVTVANLAPSIFIVDQTNNLGAILKNSDFSLVSKANPVKAGDLILIYSTGLGQTTPSVATGAVVVPPSNGFNNTSGVTVTIGGQNANVVYSIASPGFAGLYQTAVNVPTGVTGAANVVLKSGTASSNTVSITVQ